MFISINISPLKISVYQCSHKNLRSSSPRRSFLVGWPWRKKKPHDQLHMTYLRTVVLKDTKELTACSECNKSDTVKQLL